MVKSDLIDDLVSDWEQAAKKIGGDDIRGTSRDFVIANILENRHHTDPDAGKMVCSALLWLTVNGPIGKQLLPFLREGGPDTSVNVEITKVDGDRPLYNFRTTVDDKTSAQMSRVG
jgi:hypothetical protein